MGLDDVEGITHDYTRHGTTTSFGALAVTMLLALGLVAGAADAAMHAASSRRSGSSSHPRPLRNPRRALDRQVHRVRQLPLDHWTDVIADAIRDPCSTPPSPSPSPARATEASKPADLQLATKAVNHRRLGLRRYPTSGGSQLGKSAGPFAGNRPVGIQVARDAVNETPAIGSSRRAGQSRSGGTSV
jgi:hypothetical protein